MSSQHQNVPLTSSDSAKTGLKDPPEEAEPCASCNATREGKNIVLCFDGTSNQFGTYNTNVVELYSRIIKDKQQVTYYNSGIGTYARPSWRSYKYWKQVLDNKIDLAIAWNFEKIVLAGYRWLSAHYEPGDKIFLFGFSRGAYQVRVLAGMLCKVGLILPGNEEQIPFAYELFADLRRRAGASGRVDAHSKDKASNSAKRAKNPEVMAERFKNTFSRKDVKVHFLGAWDTVSSIGVIRGKSLPYTDVFNDDICYFRHALALDERRVKFLPEYVCGGESYNDRTEKAQAQLPSTSRTAVDVSGAIDKAGKVDKATLSGRVKEVWFAGCHSDIGGGSQPNEEMNNAAVPVLWMGNEAFLAGLRLEESGFEWEWDKLKYTKPRESLRSVWRLFEVVPFKRLSYINEGHTTWWPHMGKGRVIKPGQKIHASVAFIQNYEPRATFSDAVKRGSWLRILTKGRQDHMDWTDEIKDLLELDLFDHSRLRILLDGIKESKDPKSIERLEVWASTSAGLQAIATAVQDFSIFVRMMREGLPNAKQIGGKILLSFPDRVNVLASDGEKRIEMVQAGVVTELIRKIHDNDTTLQDALRKLLSVFILYDNVPVELQNREELKGALKEVLNDKKYGVLTIADFCKGPNKERMAPEIIRNYVESIRKSVDVKFATGLVAIFYLSKNEAGRSVILQTDIFTEIVSRITSGDLLWNQYSATILRQLIEQDDIRKKLQEQDIISTLFDAIGNQAFALDVFVSLATDMENKQKNYFVIQAQEKISMASPSDHDLLCGYVQAVGELARDAGTCENIIETLESHAVNSECFDVKFCCLKTLRRLSGDDISKYTRQISQLYGEMPKGCRGRRAARWLQELSTAEGDSGDVFQKEHKQHLNELVNKQSKWTLDFDKFVRTQRMEKSFKAFFELSSEESLLRRLFESRLSRRQQVVRLESRVFEEEVKYLDFLFQHYRELLPGSTEAGTREVFY